MQDEHTCRISARLLNLGAVANSSQLNVPGGVAERLNAPVLKTGRPKGLVSSNLTPSATRKNGANLPDEIANCGMHLPKIRTQFDRLARFAPALKAKRQYRSQSEALDNLTPSAPSQNSPIPCRVTHRIEPSIA